MSLTNLLRESGGSKRDSQSLRQKTPAQQNQNSGDESNPNLRNGLSEKPTNNKPTSVRPEQNEGKPLSLHYDSHGQENEEPKSLLDSLKDFMPTQIFGTPLVNTSSNGEKASVPMEKATTGLASSLNFGALARKSSGGEKIVSKREGKETKSKRSRAGSRVSRDFSSTKKSRMLNSQSMKDKGGADVKSIEASLAT